MSTRNRRRWFAVAGFFAFMLLHHADKLLIGPLATPILGRLRWPARARQDLRATAAV